MTTIDYANEQLDLITSGYEKVVDLYCEIKDQNPMYIDDVENLKEMHESVIKTIDDYFAFLKEEGIPPEDSYITYWLEKNELYNDYENDIYYFLQNHLGSS